MEVLDLTIFVSHKRPFQENTEACFNNVIVFKTQMIILKLDAILTETLVNQDDQMFPV